MEEINNSNIRFDENQKIKIYQFMTKTENMIEDQSLIHLLNLWKQIIQNAQQRKQLKELYFHKIANKLDEIQFDDEKLVKRFNHLKKLTLELCE